MNFYDAHIETGANCGLSILMIACPPYLQSWVLYMSRSTGLQRRLDRYLGNPIALMLGVLPPTAAKIENPARIGLIQPTAIGDLIIASGLIAHLRAMFPSAELHVFHGVSNRTALDLLEPGIVGHTVDFTKPVAALKHIRSLRLDILIDLVPWSMLTALACR